VIAKSDIFSGVRWARLTVGFSLTAVLALSVHVVMLQVLHVPYPSEPFTSRLPVVLNNVLAAWAAIWLYSCLQAQLPDRAPVFRIGVLFLLLCGLNETVRMWFMNVYCINPSPKSWAFQLLTGLPAVLVPLTTAILAAAASHYLRKPWQRNIGATLMALLLTFAVMPMRSMVAGAIAGQITAWAPTGAWCEMPYGVDVVIPAYLTFAEPTLAALFCVAFAWRLLNGGKLRRSLVVFTLLILALRSQLLSAFFYAIDSKMPAMTALASMGQFSLEAAALGFLMALTWVYARGEFISGDSRPRTKNSCGGTHH
jgi:hypothetical protein